MPCFSIASSHGDDELLAAAYQAEEDMGVHAHGDGGVPYDPFTTNDPWRSGNDRICKSPRTNTGRGRWDQGPLASAPRPASPGMSSGASDGLGSVSSGVHGPAPNFGVFEPSVVSLLLERVQSNVKGLLDTHAASPAAANASLNSMLSESLADGLGSVE